MFPGIKLGKWKPQIVPRKFLFIELLKLQLFLEMLKNAPIGSIKMVGETPAQKLTLNLKNKKGV